MNKPKVVHISTVHPVFDVRIFHKECRTLANAGCDVGLVVPHDRDEIVQGIQIHALPKTRGRFVRMTRGTLRAVRCALAQNGQIYHLHDPELLPAGFLLKLRGKRVVYDAHEDFPRQVLRHHWIPRSIRPLVAAGVGLLARLASRSFDGIVAATPAIAERLRTKRTVTVQNFPDLCEFLPPETTPYRERPASIAYLGVIAEARGVREMVRAMGLLPESLQARLVCAGSFSPSDLEFRMHQVKGWERVHYVGWKNRMEIARLLSQSRLGIVVLHPTPAYIESWPVKMFEYMAAGIPVVASDFPLWRQIVDGAACGLLVDPQSPQAIADSVQWLLEHPLDAEAMGRRGREAVLNRYNWDMEAKKLLGLYERLTG